MLFTYHLKSVLLLKGTSRIDQENVAKEFKEGKIHGIIATNILEEGFDIPDCDFVISYNYVGNEIGTRQAAGIVLCKQHFF